MHLCATLSIALILLDKAIFSTTIALHNIAVQLLTLQIVKKVKVDFEMYIADRKAIPVYRQSFFCSAVLTRRHYHWYAATRFALAGG